MATTSPSPNSLPLANSPTSTAISPPQLSSPTLSPPAETNANPPESSTILSPPTPVTSPPPASSPPTLDASPPPVSPPPPVVATAPPASTTSPPPPPVTITPPPLDAPSPPPPTTATPSPTSPPPPSIPSFSPVTTPPSVPTPPANPPSSPPPPATKPKLPPPTSSPQTPLHSPPPPPSVSQPPKSQPPPPPAKGESYPPPPSSSPSRRPTSAPQIPQSPKSSPTQPSQDPPKASPLKNSTAPAASAQTPPSASLHAPTSQLLHPSLANPPSENATASSPGKGGVSVGGIAAIGVTVAVIMLGLIGVVVWYMSKRKRTSQHNGGYVVPSPYGSSPRSDSNLIIKTTLVGSGSSSSALSPTSRGGLGHSQSWFTYQELFEATDGFAFDNLLGEGGFGTVYKGILTNGREVAVKQLKIGGSQGEREFKAEIETISRVHHRHLVSLVGYCIHESRRLLVYDFVANQTLHYHLHENRPIMNWATRMKVALGAAKGIAYLHEDCHPRIIHRDIKSSNILLDSKFEAQVSDFGLAKALDMDTHVSTRVMGTFGYMAPEYATSGKLTEKSDVYSFGVVLLELITGRKPVDVSQPVGDESLVEWARPLLSHSLDTGQTEGLVDPRLEKNYVESELFLMIEAAAACVRHSATKRPRMGQVVRAFDGLSPSDLSNGMRVGESGIYNSAQQSAEIRLFRRMAFGSQDCSTGFFEASRNTGYSAHSNHNQNDEGAGFSSQQRRYDLSQQPSQNRFFSSPAFSEQRSQNPNGSSLSSHSAIHPLHRSESPAFSRHGSQNFVFGTE